MLRWFQALLPRDDRFFELFAEHSHTIVAGAHALRALLEGGNVVPKYYQLVMDLEHDADDAIDQMQKTAKAAMLFDIRSFTPEMKEMGDAVVKCALLVEEAIPLLRSISQEAGQINAITEEISQIEGRADDLH